MSPDAVHANLERIRAEVGSAVTIIAATKYVALEDFGALVEAGVTRVGENRAQDLAVKAERWGERLGFDFIGHLQSRKVRDVLPLVRWIHSVASDSVLEQLGRHGTPETEVLVEVNIAGEEAKSGVAPDELASFIARCPVRVVGLMTMPPLAADPQESRPWFARLAELARENGLEQLSMGTTQDFAVAVEEGATIVRVGTRLFT